MDTHYHIFNEIDKTHKFCKYNKTIGIINITMKPALVQRHTRLRFYKTVARPVLSYESEAWTVRDTYISRKTVGEMRFTRRTAGNIHWDNKINEDIKRKLQDTFTEIIK